MAVARVIQVARERRFLNRDVEHEQLKNSVKEAEACLSLAHPRQNLQALVKQKGPIGQSARAV